MDPLNIHGASLGPIIPAKDDKSSAEASRITRLAKDLIPNVIPSEEDLKSLIPSLQVKIKEKIKLLLSSAKTAVPGRLHRKNTIASFAKAPSLSVEIYQAPAQTAHTSKSPPTPSNLRNSRFVRKNSQAILLNLKKMETAQSSNIKEEASSSQQVTLSPRENQKFEDNLLDELAIDMASTEEAFSHIKFDAGKETPLSDLEKSICSLKSKMDELYKELADDYAIFYFLNERLPKDEEFENHPKLKKMILDRMLHACLESPQGFVELLQAGSSKVYLVGYNPDKIVDGIKVDNKVPLFIIKPLDGELGCADGKKNPDGSNVVAEDKDRYEPGTGGIREFIVCTSLFGSRLGLLETVNHSLIGQNKLSFITDFVKSEGSLEELYYPDTIDMEKKSRDLHLKIIRKTNDPNRKSAKLGLPDLLSFWKKVSLTQIQKAAISDILYGNTDSNIGNVLVVRQDISHDFSLETIDFGKALPSEWTADFTRDFWNETIYVRQPVASSLKELIDNFNIEHEIERIQDILSKHHLNFSEETFQIFRAHFFLLQLGLQEKLSLQLIRKVQKTKLKSSKTNGGKGPETEVHKCYMEACNEILEDSKKDLWLIYKDKMKKRLIEISSLQAKRVRKH